jgi:hypothetical protein
MSFLPDSTKPRRPTQTSQSKRKLSLIETIAIRAGFAIFATIACVATLQYSTTKAFNTIVASTLPKTQPNQNITPAALTAAEGYLKSQNCTPLTGARLESQILAPGIMRDPSAAMAISLYGMCPKTEGKAVIAYQDNAGNVSLSEPIFVTVSLLKMSIDGTITATGTLQGEKEPKPIKFKAVGSKLVPLP